MGEGPLICTAHAHRAEPCPGPVPTLCSNESPSSPPTSFVAAYLDGLYTPAELADRFGVSRKTAYKWLARYRDSGADALADRPSVRRTQAHRTPPEVEAQIVVCRRAHPTWGPKKLLAYLARRHPDLALPAASTAGAILQRHGLIAPRARRRKPVHPGRVPLTTAAPCDVWCADFKGQFLLGDGAYCYPLAVTDAHTRFVLRCDALPSTKQEGVLPRFEALFREHGLPGAVRTDNGNPFATQAIAGLSALNVWWIKLGVGHQRIEPGRPEQNGRHERMHRTLKAETTRPAAATMHAQQARFDAWRVEFNTGRPHETLGEATPASVYRPSARPMPAQLPGPAYAAHVEVRWVSSAGTVRFKKRQFFVSKVLVHEHVGFEEVGDGVWSLRFYHVELGRLDGRDFKLRP